MSSTPTHDELAVSVFAVQLAEVDSLADLRWTE